MTLIGYHASHEQFAPNELLGYVKMAEAAGFSAAKSSDHFHPWSERQGHSGFAWTWLGAALHATSLPFGMISAPGYRYHPAVLAQAAATAGMMFPGRFWLALGSGEAINEAITGLPWPDKPERNARLRECAQIIRRLVNGETVTHRGRVTTVEAKLYSRPEQPVPLYGAAITEDSARDIGAWADGLLTTGGDDAGRVSRVINAFCEGGGEGKPVIIQAALSWARTEEEALAQGLDQWAACVVGGEVAWDLRRPGDFDRVGRYVGEEELRTALPVSADLSFHRDWIARLLELGPSQLHLHQVGRNQREFIETFGEHVLPQFVQAMPPAATAASAFRDGKKPGPNSAEVQVRAAGPEEMRTRLQRTRTKPDEASDESFPASDPPASNRFD